MRDYLILFRLQPELKGVRRRSFLADARFPQCRLKSGQDVSP
jgi:hypothetical protein